MAVNNRQKSLPSWSLHSSEEEQTINKMTYSMLAISAIGVGAKRRTMGSYYLVTKNKSDVRIC